ncbi:MAG: O-antigen ligase family protein, partial [Verrucomicrobia bacterium]|nr:O-antigen ligase family protein [Verrucomicrobiota bacterium]
GFSIVFSDYFKRGATSVSARFDYWNAAVLNIKNHPFMGSGPGTFAIPYHFSKRRESEMAKLCHNDYLEQASDSGIPASVAYLAFWGCCLYHIWRRYKTMVPLQLSIILGINTFALQALTEFSLYIPAIAWVAFALLGYSVYQARFPYLPTCSSEKEIRL